jgi:hypothetical protein
MSPAATRARERGVDRQARAEPLRMRRRHVVRVGGFAVAEQARRARVAVAFEQGEAGRLADRDAVAARVERPARLRRDEFERVEAEQHAAAQRIDAGEDDRVGEAEPDQAFALGEDLRARRARGRHRHARPARADEAVEEQAERVQRVQFGLGERGGKAAVVERAVGRFGRADARRRGRREQRDALGAVARDSGAGGVEETVGVQAEPSQAMVAAVEVAQVRGQVDRFDAVDAAYRARQRRVGEVVRAQPAAALAQRAQVRLAPAAERGRCGESGDGERRDAAGHAVKASKSARNYAMASAAATRDRTARSWQAERAPCYHAGIPSPIGTP